VAVVVGLIAQAIPLMD